MRLHSGYQQGLHTSEVLMRTGGLASVWPTCMTAKLMLAFGGKPQFFIMGTSPQGFLVSLERPSKV